MIQRKSFIVLTSSFFKQKYNDLQINVLYCIVYCIILWGPILMAD